MEREKILYLKKFIFDLETDIIKWQRDSEPLELISEEDVVAALVSLNILPYKSIADCFFGCAAVNLLNSYVKQKNSKLNYGFKRHLIEILKGIDDLNVPNIIQVTYDNRHNQGILQITFWKFQFSFKSIRFSEQIDRIESRSFIEWDGIRKQPYALSIFNSVYNCELISEMSLGGVDFKQKVEDEIELYKKGDYIFAKGNLFKRKNIKKGEDLNNDELKNYYRKKLCECGDRPVILTGKFVRTFRNYATFITVKPYIGGADAITVCDHINLLISDINKILPVNNLIKGHRYYIIGYCNEYGKGRMGVKLATNCGIETIFEMNDFGKLDKDVISVCHRFSIERNLGRTIRSLKL